ncbi:MAG: hypothetical protein JWM19_600 [Actinomycetia bacterium]|nr:hypothetical protein [Actinomycetes bacterium]
MSENTTQDQTDETEAPALSEAKAARVAFVRQHAEAHRGAGWGVVTEAATDERLSEVIGRCRTMTGAVNEVRAEIVAPWVAERMEARPGDEREITAARALREEAKANWYDATARLEGRANTVKPPRKVLAALPAVPQVVEIDLTAVEEPPAPPVRKAPARRARKTA